MLFAICALVYLATLTADYYWDGITFALQVEKVAHDNRSTYLLFHQNHLLYNGFGYLLYRATQWLGFSLRALTVMQIANALIGAFAVTVFYGIVEQATRNRYIAWVCCGALAFSAAWWKISTDIDAYILSNLFILLCANNLFGEQPRWWAAGLAMMGALLMHQLAALFYPVALVTIFCHQRITGKMRFAAAMAALAWVPTVALYYLCAWQFHHTTHPLGVIRWATSNPSEKPLALDPLGGLLLLPKLNFDAIVGHAFSVYRQHSGWLELSFALIACITAIGFVITLFRKVKLPAVFGSLRQTESQSGEPLPAILSVLIIWIAIYALFLILWGPLIYFRAFYTPALMLGVGILIARYHRRSKTKPAGAAALAILTLALFNLAFYIVPYMRAAANPLAQSARKANKVWNRQTVIYFADRKEADTSFEYFNPQTEWRRLSAQEFAAVIEEAKRLRESSGSVWLNKGAAESVSVEASMRGREIDFRFNNREAKYVELLPPR